MDSIENVINDFRDGKMVVMVDDESRENEGDLVCAAQSITPDDVNFMATHGKGLICVPMESSQADKLGLYPQAVNNNALHGCAFTVSVDASKGVTTGISSADRARTIQLLASDDSTPSDLVRPGHVFPIRAADGGVLVRTGQTEGSVDLAKLAGVKPITAICEIMNDDGSMARRDDLEIFCKKHDLKMVSVAQIVSHRLGSEKLISRAVEVDITLEAGDFHLIAYESLVDPQPHIALCMGGVGKLDSNGKPIIHDEPVLVRVHSECFTGDVLHSKKCDCGQQLATSLDAVAAAGKGAVVYVRQEGRGIGLINKLKAYKLQFECGMDTVEANEHLGFEADRRDYGVGNQILRDLGIRKLRLMTNNPRKIHGLKGFGLEIVARVPIEIPPHEHNRRYLKTKKDKLGHMLDEFVD